MGWGGAVMDSGVGREEKGGAGLAEDLISKWRREEGRGHGGKTEIPGGKPGEIWAVGFCVKAEQQLGPSPLTKVTFCIEIFGNCIRYLWI